MTPPPKKKSEIKCVVSRTSVMTSIAAKFFHLVSCGVFKENAFLAAFLTLGVNGIELIWVSILTAFAFVGAFFNWLVAFCTILDLVTIPLQTLISLSILGFGYK